MPLVVGRVQGEQLSQALFTAIMLTQPQEAERPDQQAVLTVFVLGVVIEHDEIGQGDGEEVRLDPLAHGLLGPADHAFKRTLRLRSAAETRQRHALIEEVIHRLIVVVAAGPQRPLTEAGLLQARAARLWLSQARWQSASR